MRVLVATCQLQGVRDNDFCECVEGELVVFGAEKYDCPIDGECPCRRLMVGLSSSHATTTFGVVDKPELTRRLFRDLYVDGLLRQGCPIDIAESSTTDFQVDQLLDCAAHFEPHLVLEKRGNDIEIRGFIGKGDRAFVLISD